MDKKTLTQLKLDAVHCRQNVMRMIKAGGHGHVGGALSCLDIVTACYFYKMNCDPKDPRKADRDMFLLSAGHKALAQYAVLAEKGYFEKEVLDTYATLGCHIPGHPDMHKLPGIEGNTGALGHGLSIAAGMALAQKMDGTGARTYVVMGDGEAAEGSNWEAAAIAGKYGLTNLVAFIDYNGLQIGGRVEDVMDITDYGQKYRDFGWATIDIDGNDMEQVCDVLDRAPLEEGKPTMVVAHTVKAKDLPIGENKANFHFWTPKDGELEEEEKYLEGLAAALEEELKGE